MHFSRIEGDGLYEFQAGDVVDFDVEEAEQTPFNFRAIRAVAVEMWLTARSEQQCARVVPDDGTAREIRERVRRLAVADGIKVRTARLGDTVVVVRLDAQVWNEDAATMRWKLTAG